MRLESLTRPELIFPELPASDGPGALHALAERIAGAGLVADAEELYKKLLEREVLGSTGIGAGVAIPHCKLPGLKRAAVALGIVDRGVDFGAVDGRPVRLFFLVVSPSHTPAEHLQVLAAISRWVKADRHVQQILEAHDAAAIYELLRGAP